MNYIVAKIPNLRNAQPQRAIAARNRDEQPRAAAQAVFTFDARDVVKTYYTSEDEAVAAAKALATASPLTQYGVFAAGRIFETAAPTVLEKNYNVDGELSIKTEK